MINNKDITNKFIEVADDLILTSGNNAKLAESIKWIDLQSQKKSTAMVK